MSVSKTEKRCPKCGITKPAAAFSKSSRTSDGLCVWCKVCSSDQQKRWREASPERAKAKALQYYYENKPVVREKQNERRKANRDKINARAKIAYLENPKAYHARAKEFAKKHPELTKEYAARWRSRNRHLVNFQAAKRRAVLRRATPAWADDAKIKAIFLEAERRRVDTGIPHDVDHIVPLKSPMVQSLSAGNTISKRLFVGPLIPIVQGLHCEANLRVTTEKENRLKSNIIWPDMPSINF